MTTSRIKSIDSVSVMGTLMDGLQQQINDLDYKFNQLHHIVEQVSQQISTLAAQPEASANIRQESVSPVYHPTPSVMNEPLKSAMTHKDILLDDHANNSLIAPEGDVVLSRDLQVRRLTAQLTAAYNRIAALEEQLLACRRPPTSSFMKVAHQTDSSGRV